MNPSKDTTHFNLENWIIKTLKNDPDLANEYLSKAIETFNKGGDIDSLLLSLRKSSKAKGRSLEKEIQISHQELYADLSEKGNPRIKTFIKILTAFGYRLKVC